MQPGTKTLTISVCITCIKITKIALHATCSLVKGSCRFERELCEHSRYSGFSEAFALPVLHSFDKVREELDLPGLANRTFKALFDQKLLLRTIHSIAVLYSACTGLC